jgi:hypothetical protein
VNASSFFLPNLFFVDAAAARSAVIFAVITGALILVHSLIPLKTLVL